MIQSSSRYWCAKRGLIVDRNSLQAELREINKKISSAQKRAKFHPNFKDGFDYMIHHYSSIKKVLEQHIDTLTDAQNSSCEG